MTLRLTEIAPELHQEVKGLQRLLSPQSIAIVGASEKPGSLGASVLANLIRDGFPGDIYLINPKRSEISGRACLASIEQLPDDIDAAVLAIPRAAVLDAVKSLAARRVGAAVIFAAGFAEEGVQGLDDQREIARIAQASGMIIEGPNCLGLVNFRDRVPLTFVELPSALTEGDRRVGIVSQSGAMAAVLATTMIARAVPLSAFVSTGNEAATGVEDYLTWMVSDPGTDVIGMIVEQFRRPRDFLTAARSAHSAGKTVVLLHPGRSDAGRASAATHTGAMAGDFDVMCTHVAEAGVVLVNTLEELGDVVEIAVRCRVLPRGGCGVIVESGALKAMTLDMAERSALVLPPLSNDDSPALRAALPSFVPVSNPVDVTAQGLVDPTLYERTIFALDEDPRIASVLVNLIQTAEHTAHVKFAAVAAAARKRHLSKPLLVCGVDEGGGLALADVTALREAGVPYFPTPERVIRALAALERVQPAAVVSEVVPSATLKHLPPPGNNVPEYRAKEMLTEAGFAFPDRALCGTLDQAIRAAKRLGYPVVIKAQSAALAHKSDAGGVMINLQDEASLIKAWHALHANIARVRPPLTLDGVLVETMAVIHGVEMIVGARNDDDWGPTVLVGFGGVAAELLHDVVLLGPDLGVDQIVERIGSLRLAPLLNGFRGAAAMDVCAVAEIARSLGLLLAANPQVREVDLNPVMVYPQGYGAMALDALIAT